jgi:hypothetical protein
VAARRAGTAALALALLAGGAQARGAGPIATTAPTVAGTVAVGHRLTAAVGTWTSSAPPAYTYQWFRCDGTGAHCSSVHGATAAAYTLSTRDAGKTIGLTVTASDGSGATAAYASVVGPVAGERPLLVSTSQPQVTGLAVAGRTLQVTTGTWSPAPAQIAYAWQRCNANGRLCAPIPGATASSYTVGDADVGHAIASIVVATFGTTTQQAYSTATAPAVGGDTTGPTRQAAPTITGLARQTTRLRATAGIWAGIGSVTYAYQWYRCDDTGTRCATIRGATATTYRTVRADIGKTLGFSVHASDSTGTATASSSLFGPIAPRLSSIVSTGQPALSGSPQAGGLLTVDRGTWRPLPGAVSYAWLRCNASGRACEPVEGATKATYGVTAADVGHALVAVVTALIGATARPAYSLASAPVA